MTTTYRVIPHVFDMVVFGNFLKRNVPANEIKEYAAIIGVDHSTLSNWMNNRYRKFNYPAMTNFLNVCNLFDVSPCMFFSLDVVDITSEVKVVNEIIEREETEKYPPGQLFCDYCDSPLETGEKCPKCGYAGLGG